MSDEMERFVLIPQRTVQAWPLKRQDLQILQQKRDLFGQDVVNWLRRDFCRDVNFSLPLADSDATAADDAEVMKDQKSEVKVLGFPAANTLFISGPDKLAEFLNHKKRSRNQKIFRLRHRIVSGQRDYPPYEVAQSQTWHLASPNGICAPNPRPNAGNGTWIGFVDTGIFADHREFQNRNIRFARVSNNGLRIQRGVKASDPVGHGTHMIAAAAGSFCGIAPAANIAVAGASLDLATASLAEVVLQVTMGIEHLLSIDRGDGTVGVDIINLSLGVPGYANVFREILHDARTDYGLLVVAAVGNRGPNTHDSPGDYRGVNGIGAHDSDGRPWRRCSWARYGRRSGRLVPKFFAPGVGVWSASHDDPAGYVPESGTSVASAIASGIAACIIAKRRTVNPNFLASSCNFSSKAFRFSGEKFYKILY